MAENSCSQGSSSETNFRRTTNDPCRDDQIIQHQRKNWRTGFCQSSKFRPSLSPAKSWTSSLRRRETAPMFLCLRSPRSRLCRRQLEHGADRLHDPRHPLNQPAQRIRTATQLWLLRKMSSVIRALLSSLMPSGNRAQPRFLRISEVIRRVGVSRPTIYRWMRGEPSPSKSPLVRTPSSGWSPTSQTGWTSASGRDELLSSRLSGAHKLCGGMCGGNSDFCLKPVSTRVMPVHFGPLRMTPSPFQT